MPIEPEYDYILWFLMHTNQIPNNYTIPAWVNTDSEPKHIHAAHHSSTADSEQVTVVFGSDITIPRKWTLGYSDYGTVCSSCAWWWTEDYVSNMDAHTLNKFLHLQTAHYQCQAATMEIFGPTANYWYANILNLNAIDDSKYAAIETWRKAKLDAISPHVGIEGNVVKEFFHNLGHGLKKKIFSANLTPTQHWVHLLSTEPSTWVLTSMTGIATQWGSIRYCGALLDPQTYLFTDRGALSPDVQTAIGGPELNMLWRIPERYVEKLKPGTHKLLVSSTTTDVATLHKTLQKPLPDLGTVQTVAQNYDAFF